MGVKLKTYDVRYFTYYLIFPRDKDVWVDQVPFIHDLQFELKNTGFGKDPAKARDILLHGETKWKDHNGVTHRVVIEEEKRARKWGTTTKYGFRR
jgi:hypothetical protein